LTSLDFRVSVEPQQGASYADQLAVAKAAEQLGFSAFHRSDHYVAMSGDGLPGPTDSWVTLAGLARETSTIRLGTMVSSDADKAVIFTPPNSCSESLRDSTPTGIKARQIAGRAGMFANRLKQHGINPRGGRNTAMIRLAYDLPAAIAAEGPARQIVRTG
jgi:Luciferase-like monooxygenase